MFESDRKEAEATVHELALCKKLLKQSAEDLKARDERERRLVEELSGLRAELLRNSGNPVYATRSRVVPDGMSAVSSEMRVERSNSSFDSSAIFSASIKVDMDVLRSHGPSEQALYEVITQQLSRQLAHEVHKLVPASNQPTFAHSQYMHMIQRERRREEMEKQRDEMIKEELKRVRSNPYLADPKCLSPSPDPCAEVSVDLALKELREMGVKLRPVEPGKASFRTENEEAATSVDDYVKEKLLGARNAFKKSLSALTGGPKSD